MGFLSGILGGGSSNSEVNLPDFLENLGTAIEPAATTAFGATPGTGTVAGFSPDQLAGFGAQRQIATQDPTGYFGDSQQARDFVSSIFAPPEERRASAFDDQLIGEAMGQFDRDQDRQRAALERSRLGRGAFGNRAALAEVEQEREFGNSRNRFLSELLEGSINRRVGAANNLQGLATNERNTAIQNAGLLQTIGDRYQQQQQRLLDAPFDQVNRLNQIVSGSPVNTSQSNERDSLSTVIGLAGLAAGFFKDGGAVKKYSHGGHVRKYADGGEVDKPSAIERYFENPAVQFGLAVLADPRGGLTSVGSGGLQVLNSIKARRERDRKLKAERDKLNRADRIRAEDLALRADERTGDQDFRREMAEASQQNALALQADRQAFTAGQNQLGRDAQTAAAAMKAGSESTAAMRIRQQRIADTMRLQGVDEAMATAIVDGQIKTVTDPVTGSSTAFNLATREAVPIAPSGTGRETPRITEGETEGLNIDELAQGTGLLSTAKSAIGNTAGQLFPDLVDEDNVNARTGLRQLNDKMIAAFSISGRPPVVEQERILEMLPAPGMFQSPRDAELTLTSLKGALVRQYNTDAALLDAGGLPPAQQKALIESMRLQKNIIDQLGAPSEEPQSAPATGPADLIFNPQTGTLEPAG